MTASRTPPKVPRPERAPLAGSGVVARLLSRLARADDPARVVEEFWADAAGSTPVVEPAGGSPDERVVTFLWRDADAAEVLLFANRLTDERNLADSLMRRVPGTDVWHLSYRMRADWRASYAFLVRAQGERAPWTDGDDQVAVRAALDRGLVDPRNPDAGRNRAGVVQSVVSLPAAPPATWLHPRPGVARGRVAERIGPDGRRVWVYEPAGRRHPSPVVIVLDGEVWTGSQDLPTTVDNLVADGLVVPPVLVMPDSGGRDRRWREMDAHGDAVSWIADRLLPWARAELGAGHDPADVVVAGQSLGGLTALRAGITRPDAVGAVLSQSASLWQDDLSGVLAGAPGPSRLRVHLQVGAQEWVLREPNRALARRLTDAGASAHLVEYNGGHDYACWRVGIAEGLRALLAP